MSDELKVGSIVFSPDYGKGKVTGLHQAVGGQHAIVSFAGQLISQSVPLDTLTSTNPAEALAAKDAEIVYLRKAIEYLRWLTTDERTDPETMRDGLALVRQKATEALEGTLK